MEKQPTQKHEKRPQKSCKKAPVKVVYISNPMKIKASPSEFRAVVQQLTGRYAAYPPSRELPGVVQDQEDDYDAAAEDQEEEEAVGSGTGGHVHHQQKWHRTRSDVCYESGTCREDEGVTDDFIITPQMFDGFSPLLPSDFGSSLLGHK